MVPIQTGELSTTLEVEEDRRRLVVRVASNRAAAPPAVTKKPGEVDEGQAIRSRQ